MKNMSYKKSQSDKLAIKGVMSSDGEFITYYDDDKNEQTIDVLTCAKIFAGKEVSFSISLKEDTDCTDNIGDFEDEIEL